MTMLGLRPRTFPELSYANGQQHPLKRWVIKAVEDVSGRNSLVDAYSRWRTHVASGGDRVFGAMLEQIRLSIDVSGSWPPLQVSGPLVIVANHPFGIGDGAAILSLAEQLGRPFRVLVNSELLKAPELAPYALPVDFSETKEAVQRNFAMRRDAVRLLKDGVTIVVFPAGGVATAPKGFGRAEDLPWKIFPARLIQDTQATVIPLYVPGQNGRLFHLVSRYMHLTDHDSRFARLLGRASLTLRLSMLVREFIRLTGGRMAIRVGRAIPWDEVSTIRDRKDLTRFYRSKVFELEHQS